MRMEGWWEEEEEGMRWSGDEGLVVGVGYQGESQTVAEKARRRSGCRWGNGT